ncbi:MAG TPA: carboxypeptidase-like regulatory domain-containing protein [Thermoanaerobaculia bacterium]|jgi:5-hydroxyisourate hydrolase-like protein (transthyretin family)|nr:carboxypeptidase-like regulatory domain-containing protein [Thermoanaerobaculia bacterium]
MLLAALLAATLDVSVRGTASPADAVLLVRDSSDRWQRVDLRPVVRQRVRFDRLDDGVYQLLLRGTAPGEQLATKVVIGGRDARRRVEVRIEPVRIRGRVTLAELPLVGGSVELTDSEFQWRARFAIGNDGSYDALLWQHGSLEAAVRSSALPTPWVESLTVRVSRQRDFQLPDRRLSGRVIDAVSGAAVPGATVWLATKEGEVTRNVRTTVGADGRFELPAVPAGTITLEAEAPRYLDAQPLHITLAESDRFREVELRLPPGEVTTLQVIDGDGKPAGGAQVIVAANGKRLANTMADEDGTALITFPKDAPATLYVKPRGGSFAVVRDAGRSRRVVVPRGTSSLRIVARTTAGLPLPNVMLLLRVDGELLPPSVMPLQTNAEGEAVLTNIPPGWYELWPYQTDEEAEAVFAGGGLFAAPIQVNVHVGENAVGVNFEAR